MRASRRPATSPTTSSRNAARGPGPTWCSAAGTAPTAWDDVTAAAVPRRGARRRQGPDRRRHRGRRPGRPDLPDPLRVDAARLRDLVRRRGHRAGLRDLVGRAGRAGSSATPAPRAVVAETADHVARVTEVRGRPRPSCNHVWSIDRQRGRRPDPARAATSPTSELEQRRTAATPLRPGHADLHLRHHRPAQGLHAHPRQLHVRARRGRRRAATSCSSTGRRLDAALPAAGARVRPDHPGRLPSRRGSGSATAPTSRTSSPTSQAFRPTFMLAVPRVFEKVFNTASQRATADGRGSDLRPGRRGRDRLLARPRPGQAVGRRARPARGVLAGWSTASCAPRSAAGARTPSPAARRSASGSATSTAASASPSSRATA